MLKTQEALNSLNNVAARVVEKFKSSADLAKSLHNQTSQTNEEVHQAHLLADKIVQKKKLELWRTRVLLQFFSANCIFIVLWRIFRKISNFLPSNTGEALVL